MIHTEKAYLLFTVAIAGQGVTVQHFTPRDEAAAERMREHLKAIRERNGSALAARCLPAWGVGGKKQKAT